MSLTENIKAAWEREGLTYVTMEAPNYIKNNVSPDVFYQFYNPHGEITRSELISQCEKRDRIWYYGSRHEFEVSPPLTGTTPERFERILGTHRIPRSFVCELTDVRLIGDRALPRTTGGKFVLEEMGTESMLKSRTVDTFDSFGGGQKVREFLNPVTGDLDGREYDTVINLVPRHGGGHNDCVNYGHWLLEDLPRLRAYEHYRDSTGRKPRILLKNDPPAWMKETLRLLGFSSSDWTVWEDGEAVVSRLVIPKLSYIHSIGSEFQPSDRAWVSDQMKSRVDLSRETDTPKRVFVSRQGQGRRRIVNFDEVMEAIREFGFETIRPEEMSIDDQIRVFDRADTIVGPFGAGLTNVVFANDASLVEIKPHATEHTVWYILANECGLQYDYVQGYSLDEGGANGSKDADILVDTEALRDTIQNVI